MSLTFPFPSPSRSPSVTRSTESNFNNTYTQASYPQFPSSDIHPVDRVQDLRSRLKALGLGEYSSALVEHGFEDWRTVLDITEEDMSVIGIKLGHRRVLQREINQCRAYSSSQEDSRGGSSLGSRDTPPTPKSDSIRPKRRYRRHPRPDPYAPKKPKTAYVSFSDHLRTQPNISGMSFVDIAREVGRQWQEMSAEIKREWEDQASQALRSYEHQMELYRRTPRHREYLEYLESFKKSSQNAARPKSQLLHLSSDFGKRSVSCDSDDSAGYILSPFDTEEESLRRNCQQSLQKAMSDLIRFKMRYNDISTFSSSRLPDETVVRQSIFTLLGATESLLFIISPEQGEAILSRIYKHNLPPDALTLAEACAISALGAHYIQIDGQPVPQRTIWELFTSACILLDTIPVCDGTYLRIMRMFLYFSFYGILEKSLSARSFLQAGLSIARYRFPILQRMSTKSDFKQEDWFHFRLIHRSLVFVECWLSYTLGWNLPPDAFRVHSQLALELTQYTDQSHSDIVQHQAVHLAIIASEISTAVRNPKTLVSDYIRHLANKLDAWQRSVPVALNMGTVLAGQAESLGPFAERCLVMMHILYLGAVTLLYHRFLVSDELDADMEDEEVAQYRRDCRSAAEHVPKMLDRLQFGGVFPPKCWLTIYWSFIASNVLLQQTAHLFSKSTENQQAQHLLSSTETCLNALRSCAPTEPIAGRFLGLVEPTWKALADLDAQNRRKMDIRNLLSQDSDSTPTSQRGSPTVAPADLDGLKHHTNKLLNDPFGREQVTKVSPEMETERDDSDINYWFM